MMTLRDSARRVAVLGMVLMVVLAGGPAQVAAATGDCSEVDEFFWVLSIGLLNEQCDSSQISQEKAELEDDLANSTETNIYNNGQTIVTTQEQFLTVMTNSMGDSGTVAMAKAEAAAMDAIDAGLNQSDVEAAAVEAIQDYYTVKQQNLAERWNTDLEAIYTMRHAAEQNVDVSDELVHMDYNFHGGGSFYGYDYRSPGQVELTTIDGNSWLTKTHRFYWQYSSSGGDKNDSASVKLTDGVKTFSGSGGDWGYIDPEGLGVSAIDGEPSYVAVDFQEYADQWDSIVSKSTQMEANAQEYAIALHNASEAGEINSSTYVSAATLSQEYSTDYNSTGYYVYAVAWAGTAGFAIPNLNETSLMTVQTATDIYQGLVLSNHPPDSGVWEVGVSYNAEAIQGKQFVARTDGEVTELTGEFSITSMEDQNGNAISNTTVQKFDYSVANNSADFAALQEEIRKLQEEIANVDPSAVGGGATSGKIFGLSRAEAAIGAAGLAGAGYLYMSQGGGGSGPAARPRRRRR